MFTRWIIRAAGRKMAASVGKHGSFCNAYDALTYQQGAHLRPDEYRSVKHLQNRPTLQYDIRNRRLLGAFCG
ncbi:hypothetical protein KI387_027875, partial [Taxus chinensis]